MFYSKKQLKSKVHNINQLKKRVGSLEKVNKLHVTRHSDVQSIHSRDLGDFDKYSSNEKPYKKTFEKPIQEADQDLEHTGKFKDTASFGKTYDRKIVKISTSQDEMNSYVQSIQNMSKTPHMNKSPIKVYFYLFKANSV